MNILIRALQGPLDTHWQVSLGKHHVSFRSEGEARQFVATLEARVQAPHVLPGTQRLAS